MNDAIQTPEFREWLRGVVARTCAQQFAEERRAYWHRFFTSWVADDPAPTYSNLDRADGRRSNLEL